jgi:hypothetical protein
MLVVGAKILEVHVGKSIEQACLPCVYRLASFLAFGLFGCLPSWLSVFGAHRPFVLLSLFICNYYFFL